MPTLRSATQKEVNQSSEISMETHQQQWIMVGPKSIGDGDENTMLCKLPHPQNGIPTLYAFQNKQCYEFMKFHEEFRSWLVNNFVQRDGSLTFITPVDPLFLVLPYLEKAAKLDKFTTLDNILVDEDHTVGLRKLEECLSKENLLNICNMKFNADFVTFKADDEKILKWLSVKVHQLSSHLWKSSVNTCPGAQVSTFSRTSAGNKKDSDCLRYAWTLISDYLTTSWSKKLKDKLGVIDPVKSPNEEIENICQPKKKQKLESNNGECLEDYRDHAKKTESIKKPTTKLNAKQKALQKVDKKGMKSMTSFFASKSQKK